MKIENDDMQRAASSLPGSEVDLSASTSGPEPRRIQSGHTDSFVRLLRELKVSLLVSTYQAGKVVVVGVRGDQLFITYHNFDRAMGIAVAREQIAVGTNTQVWFCVHSPPNVQPGEKTGPFDAYYLARGCHFTGEIHGHEMEWSGRQLWVVNTLFSCLCTIGGSHSFAPRWKPRFVSALAAEDRCHLNGLALENGQPRFVTSLGKTDSPRGWRDDRASGGCLIDVPSGQVLVRGLCMPHSPRLHEGRLWFLESGHGRLLAAEPGGRAVTMAELPGYARGLSLFGSHAFVGLSKVRAGSSFEGLPIAGRSDSLKCGVAAVELASGEVAALLEFEAGIEEIFDVRVNPFARAPLFSGPDARTDGTPPIWIIPPSRL
jgi:uncharacterized protein (TIGR03032 family)